MRYFIAIGSPECPRLGLAKLDKVESDVKAVAELLGSECQGYNRALEAEVPLGARSGVIMDHVSRWFLDDARTEGDCVVIYVAGHGDSFGQFKAHCLLTSDTEPRNLSTVIKVEDLVERFFQAKQYPQSILLILDVCYAGQGAAEALAKAATSLKKGFPSGTGLWVIATSDRNTEAHDGAFVRAWQAVMQDKNGAWLSPGGKEFLHPDELAYAVNERLDLRIGQRVIPLGGGGPDKPPFIKNPWYTRELDGVTVDIANHWSPKARGDDMMGATGPSYFTGRVAVLSACRAWLHAKTSDGLARVVTGAPGSGKSAVLGQIVLDPAESASPLARVHADGQQAEEVALSIARQLGCKETKPNPLVSELAAWPHPVGIVVDSLDEAANPAQLEQELLRRLAACPPVRLIVGVRSRPGTPPLAGSRVDLDLDSVTYFDSADVEGYSYALLTATRDGRPAAYTPGAAREVARFVAERAGKSFLYARLASRGLAAADPVDTADPAWKAHLRLPDGIEAMFGADLNRFEPGTRQRFIDLLVPLAYARRRGLPQKHIWAAVASRIAGTRYTNTDIRELKERAGFYLIQDTEDGETVYRLFHQSFADYLKAMTRDDDVEGRFAAALADLVAEAGGWFEVREPYLLAAFPSHAAAAGRLGPALADAAFLVNVSPAGLLPELHKVSDPRAWPLAQAYRQASHWFAAGNSREGARYLLLAALKYGVTALTRRLSELFEEDSAWWPRWARWSGTTAGWVAVEAHASISALCASRDPVVGPLAVCGHSDGSVSAWRLDQRARVLDYRPTGKPARVTSLVVADCRGERIVVGAWEDGSVWAFRQATGETTGHWGRAIGSKYRRSPTNLVTVDQEGTPLVAVGQDTELLLLELPTLAVRACRPDAAKAALIALASARWNHRPVLVSAGDTMRDGETTESYPVKVWDVDGLECLREGGEDLTIARSLLAFEEAGESYLLVTEWIRMLALRVTDLGPAAPKVEVAASFIAAYPTDGHTVIFGSDSSHMGVWTARRVQAGGSAASLLELESESIGADVSGSRWSTIVELNERPVLLSATDDRVNVWDVIELLAQKGSPAMGAATTAGVTSLAARGDSLFLGTEAGSVLAWDRVGEQLWSRDLKSGAIRCLAVADGGAELLAGSANGMIHRLDAASGAERHPSLAAGSDIRALVVRPTARGEQILAAIEIRGPIENLHFARIWALPDATEIPTWKTAAGPDVLRDSSDWKQDDYGANGFRPELALMGYYRWKTLYALAVLEVGGRTFIAVAGPGGEVRVVDAGTLRQVVSWVGGNEGDYVHSLVGGLLGGSPYVFGGDERGVLFRGRLTTTDVDPRQRPRAHQGWITALNLRETPSGGVVVSGGADGWVRFWTPDIEPLDEIHAGRPVTSLVWSGDDLVIGTDRGVIGVTVYSESL